jgi:hypothetical protein
LDRWNPAAIAAGLKAGKHGPAFVNRLTTSRMEKFLPAGDRLPRGSFVADRHFFAVVLNCAFDSQSHSCEPDCCACNALHGSRLDQPEQAAPVASQVGAAETSRRRSFEQVKRSGRKTRYVPVDSA